MTSLLIYEPTWQRIRRDLAALPPHDLFLFGADGIVRDVDKNTLPETELAPDAAWLNTDVWLSDRSGAFADIIKQAPTLNWLQSAAAGTDLPVIQAVLAKGARLCTSHVQASAIAESVIGRILALFQHENERATAQAAHRWQVLPFRELLGSKWLIVGFGAIGEAIAERVRPFGAEVVGIRRTQSAHALADRIAAPCDLAQELSEADIVVLCLPLDSNVHLFDAEMLGNMKRGSILVNVARGAIVDTAALLAALDDNRIGSAILDVFETEPLPENSPLWSHPRATISAHCTALGMGSAQRGDALFIDNFGRFLRGEPLRWEFSPAARARENLMGQPVTVTE